MPVPSSVGLKSAMGRAGKHITAQSGNSRIRKLAAERAGGAISPLAQGLNNVGSPTGVPIGGTRPQPVAPVGAGLPNSPLMRRRRMRDSLNTLLSGRTV